MTTLEAPTSGGLAGLADWLLTQDPTAVAAYVAEHPEAADVIEAAIEFQRGRSIAWTGHKRIPTEWATPGELAKTLDPTTVQTPALQLIDEALVDVEAGRCSRLIISMPPQEGKSTRTTRHGITWILRRNPDLRIGLVSYQEQVARRLSQQIRDDVLAHAGQEGGVDLGLRLARDTKAAGRWNLARPARGGVYAVGIGGGLTSIPLDMLVIDDPVKDYRAADSEVQSEDAWEWWQSVARPRLAPGAPVILILTRWSEKDLAGRMLAKQAQDEKAGERDYDRWRVLNIPAQADHDPAKGESDPLGREPGEFMISARGRTDQQWRATKTATAPRIWFALYQGRPSPQEGSVFKRPWWRRYDRPLWSQQPDGSYLVPEADEVLQSWDMAFKDKKTSDFVVGQVWARRGAEVFLVDELRARLSFTDTLAAVRRIRTRWPQCRAKLVEDKANGTAVLDSLRKEIPGLIAVTPHESKYARASAVAPFVQAGNVWVPETAIALFDVDAYLEELAQFDTGPHDDRVDATSQALARFYLAGGQGVAFTEAWKELAAKDQPRATCQHRWRGGVCLNGCGESPPEADPPR